MGVRAAVVAVVLPIGAGAVVVPGCSLEGLTGGAAPARDGGGDSSDGAPAARSCPGCEPLVSDQSSPTELALVGGALVWIRTDGVASSDLSGQGVTAETQYPLVGGHDLVASLDGNNFESAYAVGADGVMHRYFSFSTCNAADGITHVSTLGASLVMVRSGALAVGGCSGNSPLLGDDTIVGVLGDAPRVWFTRKSGAVAGCDASSVARCAASVATLADGQGGTSLLAADDARVFWVAPGPPAEIRSRLKSDSGTPGQPAVIASPVGDVKALVAAGGNLYWTDAARGVVAEAPSAGASGGTVVELARGLARPWGLVVSGAWIYFAESDAGRIVRMPR